MPDVKIYTTDFCSYCEVAKRLLEKIGISYQEINIHGNAKMRDEIEALTGRRDVPQIFIDDQHIGDDDDLADLVNSGKIDSLLNLNQPKETKIRQSVEERNTIIIGGGTAGFSAGVYTSRAMLEPLLLTGDALGGQLSLTLDLENYPGYFGTEANEFIMGLKQQAEKFGTETRFETVTDIDFSQHPFLVTTHDQSYLAKSVIICTGSSPRTLNITGEHEYGGKGVSYCATCDGFFFQDQRLIVVGGGDAALEEGIFLTKYASEVFIVHRRNQLRASQIMQERAFKNDKIKFIWDTVVEEVIGDEQKVTGAKLKNVKNDTTEIFPIDGVFVFIGHLPNNQLFKNQIDLDDQGYVIVDQKQHTNISGVWLRSLSLN